MTDRYSIALVGLGYVGMSLMVPSVRQNRITALDIDEQRIALVNAGRPSVTDPLMTRCMSNEQLALTGTEFFQSEVVEDLQAVKTKSDITTFNRMTSKLLDV